MPSPGFGAGGSRAGGRAGYAPLHVPAPPRAVSPPAALWFDGASQDFLLDEATGLYLQLNPVDQQVALALCVALGSMPSAPSVGAAYRSIVRITRSTKTEVARDANAALLPLVQARLVQVVGVVVELYTFGGFAVAVSYVNLTTKRTPTFALPQGTFTGQ